MKLAARSLSVGIAACALFAASAHGQCEDQWLPGTGNGQVSQDVFTSTTWDPDGAGPLPGQLVIAGDIDFVGDEAVNRIVRWDSAAWQQLGGGVDGIVRALVSWDPDGQGPAAALLIAGGEFLNAGGAAAARIAAWDGVSWRPVGGGVDGTVFALGTWDPDGEGPSMRRLIAGGSFANAGSTAAGCIAAWDGVSWTALADGFGGGTAPAVTALTTWDPDGAGADGELLYAGGRFVSSGATVLNSIASWDGSQWRGLGMGITTSSATPGVTSMIAWDPDGMGPVGERLVIVGDFNVSIGGTLRGRAATWDGTTWGALGPSLANYPRGAEVVDFDGPGPQTERLVIFGKIPRGISSWADGVLAWTGTAWETMDSGDQASSNTVYTACLLDPDGDGSRAAQLIVAGTFTGLGASRTNNIAVWDSGWRSLGSRLSGEIGSPFISTLRAGDPDGDGPLPEQLIAGGSFSSADGVACGGLARWDGREWRAFAPALDGSLPTVECMTEWDPDGPGPQRPLLIVGGTFTKAGSLTVNNIAAWNGMSWSALGTGMTGTISGVYALTTWDPDGTGPQIPLLIAGGRFTSAGGQSIRGIAAWNGASWSALGPGFNNEVYSLVEWDRDGAGPETPLLVAGGWCTVVGTTIQSIACWDGTSWTQLGQPTSYVFSLYHFDRDGSGPEAPAFIAAAGASSQGKIMRLDGDSWTSIGVMNAWVDSVIGWDPDGSGPEMRSLVATGQYTAIFGVPFARLARWNGVEWLPFGDGLSGPTSGGQPFTWGITAWGPDGPGMAGEQLFVGGRFARAGDVPSFALARWGSPEPWFALHPESLDGAQGGTVVFSATPAAGLETRGPASFRWRHNGQEIFDGPTAGGSVVAGSATPTLYITNVQPDDRGDYDCGMATECGGAVSRPASLTMSSCTADLSGDGVVDFGDYLEFLNLYDALDPRVDFNQDGVIDFGDYLEFLNHLDAGC